jgi:hypothetical protein
MTRGGPRAAPAGQRELSLHDTWRPRVGQWELGPQDTWRPWSCPRPGSGSWVRRTRGGPRADLGHVVHAEVNHT